MNGRRKRRREGEKKRNKQCPLHSTRVPHCETASNLPYVQMGKRSNVQILKKSHEKRKINVLPASSCWSKDPVAAFLSSFCTGTLLTLQKHVVQEFLLLCALLASLASLEKHCCSWGRQEGWFSKEDPPSFLPPCTVCTRGRTELGTGDPPSTAKQQGGGGGVRARTADTHTTPPAALRRKSGISEKYLEKI